MPSDHVPHQIDQRCPRCDQILTVACAGHGSSRDLTLACPEPYCDYVWSPSQRELARMTKLRGASEAGGSIKRAAG